MGFEVLIATAISLALLMLIVYSFAIGASMFIEVAHSSREDLHKRAVDRIQTRIEIKSVEWNSLTRDINVSVFNSGSTKIDNFGLMDVIVVYNEAKYLRYETDWKATIENETINPGILDPGETLAMLIYGPFEQGTVVWMKICTPNGVCAASRYVIGG
ncbi:hypothetical protein Asulf_00847 [Archaeoglobus sulfaticallidus PM70-1]|uniref:Archaeal flagellar protein F n=1 Tax=Archaeoglobus sulfaticallidus PM70-1 TaxID=387631 RepID=N0BKW6_9EURY|nr:hypothetical protein [Archaeoglobus sulfaticallidus]AGK60855.1 hypothetical protein Asulf_00847 [Archaeoglobus sulfaticallidus PM70-1]